MWFEWGREKLSDIVVVEAPAVDVDGGEDIPDDRVVPGVETARDLEVGGGKK